MRIAIAAETDPGEPRVGGTPETVKKFKALGAEVLVARGAGLGSGILDADYEAAGARVVGICQAEPERARAVAARREYQFPVLCDPELRAYRAFGLLEGLPAQVLHDFPWRAGDEETAQTLFIEPRRGTERAVVDSPWQLPGEFVIAADGRIALAHRYQYCEDFAPKTVLLGAIAAAD